MAKIIRIIKTDFELDEERLSQLEGQGITLISVNYVKEFKLVDDGSGWEDDIETSTWVYHFRCAGENANHDRYIERAKRTPQKA